MKKVLALVAAAVLACSLAGCGSQPANDAGKQVQGKTDAESVARAKALLDSLSTQDQNNYTEVDTVKTTFANNGAFSVVTLTKLLDLNANPPRLFIQEVTDPALDTDATYYINGKTGVIEQEGVQAEIEVSDEYINNLLDKSSEDQFKVFFDAATSISYYKDLTEIVRIQVDPAKIIASGIFPDFKSITNCDAEYTFNQDGQITVFISTVKGILKDDKGAEQEVTIETKCMFTDYGSTQVPEVPAVPAG